MTKRLEALHSGDFMDFWGSSNPKCPHCGSVYDVQEQEAWFLYNEQETHEIECVACDLPFYVNSSASWSFSTDEQEES